MPPTTENIPEKPPFDVYGMMLILCFLFTLGATLLLNDELDKHWDFWAPKDNMPKKATHLTEINDQPDKYPELINVRKLDLDEWKITSKSVNGGKEVKFPEENFAWPEGYDPLANPVIPFEDNLTKLAPDVREKLMKGRDYGDGGGAAPAPKTEAPAPKADAPAETPKADAPKADAPKADAPKADK